jgi:replicative DNA helicase
MIEFGRAVEQTWELPLFIDDRPARSIDALAAEVRRTHRESLKRVKARLGWVMLDFMQLVEPQERRRGQNRTNEIAECMKGIAALAKNEHLPVIALSQFTREVEAESPYRPDLMKYFLDGGAIEALAHRALYLYKPGHYGDEEIVRAFCRDHDLAKYLLKMGGAALEEYARPLRDVLEVGIIKQRSGAPRRRCCLHTDFAHYRISDLEGYERRALAGEREGSEE